jgi:hypothetical protein
MKLTEIGNRTGSMGRIDNHGCFIPDPDKKRIFVVPEKLNECKLRAYVSHTTPKLPSTYDVYDLEWYYREALKNDTK